MTYIIKIQIKDSNIKITHIIEPKIKIIFHTATRDE